MGDHVGTGPQRQVVNPSPNAAPQVAAPRRAVSEASEQLGGPGRAETNGGVPSNRFRSTTEASSEDEAPRPVGGTLFCPQNETAHGPPQERNVPPQAVTCPGAPPLIPPPKAPPPERTATAHIPLLPTVRFDLKSACSQAPHSHRLKS